MARRVATDFLQANSFWLMDIAPIEPLAVPIFTPVCGFTSISAPEVSLETFDIVESNKLWKKHVVKKGEVNTVTLTRGTTFNDSDFYRWTMTALRGSTLGLDIGLPFPFLGGVTPRRDLVLIQFFRRDPEGVPGADGAQSVIGTAVKAAGAVGLLSGAGNFAKPGGAAAKIGAVVNAVATAAAVLGPWTTFSKKPARAWMLGGCLPTRYKPGSDFDASSGEISIAELDVAVESFEEVSLAIL